MKHIIFAALAAIPAAALAVSPPSVKDQCSQKVAPQMKRSAMIGEAKIKPAEAQTIALDATKGTKIAKGRIEDSEGCLVYSFEVRNETNNTQTALLVDAGNGKVLWKETAVAPATPIQRPVDNTRQIEAVTKQKMAVDSAKKAAPGAAPAPVPATKK